MEVLSFCHGVVLTPRCTPIQCHARYEPGEGRRAVGASASVSLTGEGACISQTKINPGTKPGRAACKEQGSEQRAAAPTSPASRMLAGGVGEVARHPAAPHFFLMVHRLVLLGFLKFCIFSLQSSFLFFFLALLRPHTAVEALGHSSCPGLDTNLCAMRFCFELVFK